MSLSALTWAMAQETRHPETKLVLIMMADQSAGSGEAGWLWVGNETSLAGCCEMSVWSVAWALGRLALDDFIEAVDKETWRLNVAGHRCVTCRSTDDLTLDHIHPRALGGSDEEDNLQTMCRPCNSRKGARV